MTASGAKPIRRVVTGNDERGRSKVVIDGPAPNSHKNLGISRYFTDLWVWNESPAPLSGEDDAGNFKYGFPGPDDGGHLRIVEWPGRPPDYDPSKDDEIVPVHPPKIRQPGRTWDKGGNSAYASAIHKTETIDYGIVVAGERILILEDRELVMKPGDTVIQVAAYHQWKWTNPDLDGLMVFDMFAARFDNIVKPLPKPLPLLDRKLMEGVKPARRIVLLDEKDGDDGAGKSNLVVDGPSPDVRFDPARPGFASTRLWVTDATPATLTTETLHLPHTIEPPANGSVCRMISIPPDDTWRGKVGSKEVAAWFAAMGSPQASTYSSDAPHPYMQKTKSLDFIVVLEGEVVLVLDTQEVTLKAGEIAIIRGSNHAFANRTQHPAQIAHMSHDGAW